MKGLVYLHRTFCLITSAALKLKMSHVLELGDITHFSVFSFLSLVSI